MPRKQLNAELAVVGEAANDSLYKRRKAALFAADTAKSEEKNRQYGSFLAERCSKIS